MALWVDGADIGGRVGDALARLEGADEGVARAALGICERGEKGEKGEVDG